MKPWEALRSFVRGERRTARRALEAAEGEAAVLRGRLDAMIAARDEAHAKVVELAAQRDAAYDELASVRSRAEAAARAAGRLEHLRSTYPRLMEELEGTAAFDPAQPYTRVRDELLHDYAQVTFGMERRCAEGFLREHDHVVAAAAEHAGINRQSFYRLMRRVGL